MKKILIISLIFLFSTLSSAWGTSIIYELGTEFSGAADPVGIAPWVTATFDDSGTPGSVDLTISNVGLTGTEFISEFYFNFEGTALTLPTLLPPPGSDPIDGISYSPNSFKADGDGFFDVLISFNQSGDRFTAGETVTLSMTGTGIVIDDFNFLSLGAGNSPDGLYVAAHIQSIVGSPDGTSGWITGEGGGTIIVDPIPEPGTLVLLGCGLLGMAGLARKKRSQ